MIELDGYNEAEEQQPTYDFEQAYQAMLHGIRVKVAGGRLNGMPMEYNAMVGGIVCRQLEGVPISLAPMYTNLIDGRYVAAVN